MPILFSAVANGTEVLAQCASCVGNFIEVMNEVLSKISLDENKKTLFYDNYHFHYITANGIVYFCITDDQYYRSHAFSFLNEIHRRFYEVFGDTPPTALPYAALLHPSDGDFSRTLETEMKKFNAKVNVPELKADLEQLKKIVAQSVENVAHRGERLEALVDRTDGLASTSDSFKRKAVQVQRKYWWQNMKMNIVIGVVTVVLVYFISAAVCGLRWQNCVK